MNLTAGLLRAVDSRLRPTASCKVCGEHIPAGTGLIVAYAGRIVRFKCVRCLQRFAADPGRHMGQQSESCCGPDAAACSPASEWACD